MKFNNKINPPKGKIVIYQSKDRQIQLDVKLEKETVWLTQMQISRLFGTQRPAVTKHLNNIFKSGELSKDSVCSILEQTASDGKKYTTKFYNLDAIISVGYRINSSRATQFRIWATSILKKHLINGYTLNERLLKEQTNKLQKLQRAIKLIGSIKEKKQLEHGEALGLLDVINDYNRALELLDEYDSRKVKISQTSKEEKFQLTYEIAKKAVAQLKKKLSYAGFFGQEKDHSFKSSIVSIYQTFGGKDLYPSIEEKAAHLLYFIVKNHSFIDGNKRIAASVFLWFLKENRLLYRQDGTKRIADNALVALTLLIAESDPKEKEIIMALAVNLINRRN